MKNSAFSFQKPMPPYVKRFIKQTGRGINRFSMIREGDSVLIGVSGGKDSLALALALSLRRQWLPITYSLSALQIEWRENPLEEEKKKELRNYFRALDIPLEFKTAGMFPESFHGKFDCYLCSRNRKRILFEEAEKRGICKIALGHHMDDIVETTVINLFFRGSFATMMPVQDFFKGKIRIIRPMCEVKESQVQQITERLCLPVLENTCPYHHTNIRTDVKPIIKAAARLNKRVRENIYKALWNINTEYLPKTDNPGLKE